MGDQCNIHRIVANSQVVLPGSGLNLCRYCLVRRGISGIAEPYLQQLLLSQWRYAVHL